MDAVGRFTTLSEYGDGVPTDTISGTMCRECMDIFKQFGENVVGARPPKG